MRCMSCFELCSLMGMNRTTVWDDTPVSFQKPSAWSRRESSHRHLNLQYALISMDWLPANGDRCLHRPLPSRIHIPCLVVVMRLPPWSIVYRPIGRIPGFDRGSIGHSG